MASASAPPQRQEKSSSSDETDLERGFGPSPAAMTSSESSVDCPPRLASKRSSLFRRRSPGWELRWAGLEKSVEATDASGGLLRGSIAVSDRSRRSSAAGGGVEAGSPDPRPTKKVILNEVSGCASPGEVLALMGPSGSGKTSLLNALSGRSALSSGQLSVDGTPVTPSVMKRVKRKIAYVKQQDVFFEHLTIRDQLTYTALLRLPDDVPTSEKHAEVELVLETLRLTKCADTPIRAISGGEKKRTNIGTELLTDPRVLMLDEPTSGLDSSSAVSLLRLLHSLAKESGKTIITSIHQPSSAMFFEFDKLLMLADGNVVYSGTPGRSLDYLSDCGFPCPSGYNAADHWMDLLVVDGSVDDSVRRFNDKEEYENSKAILIEAWEKSVAVNQDSIPDEQQRPAPGLLMVEGDSKGASEDPKYNTTWSTQTRVLMHRCLKNSRSAIFTPLNMIESAVVGVVIGLLYFQMAYTEKTVTDRVSYYFFTMTYWVFDAMFGALMAFPQERTVVLKERASGSYHLSAYFTAKTLSEMPTRLFLPFIYMIISYWLALINPSLPIFLASTGCTLLCVLAGESIGLVVGASIPEMDKAMVVMTVFSLMLMVVGGFFVQNVPAFASWVKYMSPFKYSFDASQQLVFDRPVPCDGSGVLEACRGFDSGYASVDQVKLFLNANGSIGFNIGMLCIMIFVVRYIAFLALKRQKATER